MLEIKFRYPVYNPCVNTVDVAADWGDFDTTQCRDTALNQPFSIAAMRVFYDEPWIFGFDPVIAAVDVSEFDLVLLSDIEYYSQQQIQDWAVRKGIKKYVLALGGLNNETLADNVVYRPYWAKAYLRNKQPAQLNCTVRPYMFDCLLGARRPHRDYAMLALTQTGLLDQNIVTYRDCFPGEVIDSSSELFANLFSKVKLNWPYISPNLDPAWEISDQVTNQANLVSPTKIFQQTNYSIITETLGTGDTFFLSEKTTKYMHAYRPFIVFGPRHHLRRLNDMGFQTFSTAIDESYDDEPIDAVRFQKAMLQVIRLAYFEPVESVYNKIQFALENNAAHIARIVAQKRQEMELLLGQHISYLHLKQEQSRD
jgi:hypothetical protein